MMSSNKFIFLKSVLLLLCILLLETCGQNKNIATQNKLEPFNFDQRDTNASIIGRWKLYEIVTNRIQVLNKFDLKTTVENKIFFYLKCFGVETSAEDSILIAINAKKLLKNLDDFYLEFYPNGKVEGKFVYTSHRNWLVKYKSVGNYIIDGCKIKMKLPYGRHDPLIAGLYDWAIYEDQLRLYDDYGKSFSGLQERNDTCYSTFYKE